MEKYGGDGTTWKITWDKVKGAEGYQVKEYSISASEGRWESYYKVETKKNNYSIGYSDPEDYIKFKVKVRAYKTDKNGKKVYGKWAVSKAHRY